MYVPRQCMGRKFSAHTLSAHTLPVMVKFATKFYCMFMLGRLAFTENLRLTYPLFKCEIEVPTIMLLKKEGGQEALNYMSEKLMFRLNENGILTIFMIHGTYKIDSANTAKE